MKNPLEMLKKISNLLNVELSEDVAEKVTEKEVEAKEVKIELAQMTLDNGAVIEAETFEEGAEVFIISDEDKIPLPIGEYKLEDGQVLKVESEGIISSIGAEAEEEVEAAEEEEMGYATKMELEEVKKMVEEIKEMVSAMDYDKEKMSEQVADVEDVKEKEQLKEELSKPAAKPIKHNPENKTNKKQILYSTNRPMDTVDIVMRKISNIKHKN